MKKSKRWLTRAAAVIASAAYLFGSALAAPSDGGGGGNGGGGGGNSGGPPQVYLTVELAEGSAFTYGDVTLTLADAEGNGFTLTQGEKQVACTSQYEEITEGKWPGIKGIAHLSQLTVTGTEDMDALCSMMPQYWAKDMTLILNQDGTFSPTIDVNEAAVAYTADSVKNDASATGYTTTISVSDPDKSYSSVLAYGMWMCSYMDDEEAVAYEPEKWENGMYYSGYGIRALNYDESAKSWTLSLDLASANMKVACYANVGEDMLSDVDDPDSSISIPYDEVKQSKSFDWSNTAPCAQAGTLTTVQVDEEITLRVYTPYGYDAADTATRYPVVYLVAGMNASYDSWLDGGGNANVIFDNLIAEGAVAPTILVAMERDVARMDCYDVWDSADDRAKSNGDGDGYINYVDGAAKGSGTENMISSTVITTVIPYIDANYNTAADAEHRGIIGCSMGGVAASQIWLADYEMFNFYGFFSGSDMWFKEADDKKADPEYMALRDTYEADYTALLNAVAANMDGVKILVGGGITDRNTFGGDQNSSGSDNISAWMTEAGIEHDYSVVGGEHDWASWTQLLDQFAGYLAEEDTTWQVKKAETEGEAEGETVVFVHTNDVHGHIGIEPYVKTVADGYKAEYGEANVITVSAGDIFAGGQTVAHMTNGDSVVEIMNAAGYDAATVGNNDIPNGLAELVQHDKDTNFPILCANMVMNEKAGELGEAGELPLEPYTVFTTASGVKIGMFGLTTTGSPPASDSDLFTKLASIETAQKYVDILKNEEKVDIVVALGHAGWPDNDPTFTATTATDANSYQISMSVEGIDLFIDGHTHSIIGEGKGHVCDNEKKTLIVQTGCFGDNIGVVTMKIDSPAKSVVEKSAAQIAKADYTANYTPDAAVAEIVEKWTAMIEEKLGAVVGHTEYYLNGERTGSEDGMGIRMAEQNLGNLVTDAIRETLGGDIAFFSGVRIRSSIEAGDITLEDLYALFANGGTIVKVELTGAAVKEFLESAVASAAGGKESPGFAQVSGISFVYDTEGKILSATLDGGTNLEDDKTYTVVGELGKAPEGAVELYDGADQLVELFADYLASDMYEPSRYEGKLGRITRVETGAAVEAEAPTEPSTEPSVETYVVVSGDSLWSIAAKTLGSGAKWNAIYEANKDIIKNPNLIYAGQILVLP